MMRTANAAAAGATAEATGDAAAASTSTAAAAPAAAAALILAALTLLSWGCGAGPGETPASYKSPGADVILVSFDTLRVDHLGCYGHRPNTSPHLDRFSREAVLFENAIAQASSTKPSHASLFTGLNVAHHGTYAQIHDALGPEMLTMAEIMSDAGYRAVSFNAGSMLAAEYGFDQGFEKYQSFAPRNFIYQALRAWKWMERFPGDRHFIFLHTYEVHHPYTPAPHFAGFFRAGYRGVLPDWIDKKTIDRIDAGEIELDAADLAHIRNMYDAELMSMDEAFGALIRHLKRIGRYDGTLIVVLSDHGEELGDHGRVALHSHTLFDELIRVPLLIKFPRGSFGGTRVGGQVRLIDVLPTVLDVVDVNLSAETGNAPPVPFEGVSLVEGIRRGETPDLPAVSQLGENFASIRTGRWKLYGATLYDLEGDPLETRDVADGHAGMKQELERRRTEQLRCLPIVPRRRVETDDETMQQLRELGYVGGDASAR